MVPPILSGGLDLGVDLAGVFCPNGSKGTDTGVSRLLKSKMFLSYALFTLLSTQGSALGSGGRHANRCQQWQADGLSYVAS